MAGRAVTPVVPCQLTCINLQVAGKWQVCTVCTVCVAYCHAYSQRSHAVTRLGGVTMRPRSKKVVSGHVTYMAYFTYAKNDTFK